MDDMLTLQKTCGNYNSAIQSYCDAADPVCYDARSDVFNLQSELIKLVLLQW